MSRDNLPIEHETIPLHVVSQESPEARIELTRIVLNQPVWWAACARYLALFHPQLLQEIERMAQSVDPDLVLDLRPYLRDETVPQQNKDRMTLQVIEGYGIKRAVELVGLQQVIDEVGLGRVIDEVSPGRVIEEIGPEGFWAALTPEQRQQLRERAD